jgi:hypothetical protein
MLKNRGGGRRNSFFSQEGPGKSGVGEACPAVETSMKPSIRALRNATPRHLRASPVRPPQPCWGSPPPRGRGRIYAGPAAPKGRVFRYSTERCAGHDFDPPAIAFLAASSESVAAAHAPVAAVSAGDWARQERAKSSHSGHPDRLDAIILDDRRTPALVATGHGLARVPPPSLRPLRASSVRRFLR